MDKPILIACDGSALKTRDGKIGGPIGWAWAREDGHWMSAGLPAGTNQRAEVWALLSTLIFHPKGDLHIQSDSQYTLNVAQKWRWGWARNNWRKAGGEPVLNQDLIRPLHELLVNRKGNITYQWVKGHLKDNRYPLNTAADLRAQQASNRAKTFTFDALAPYNYADSKDRDHSPTMQQLFEWVGTFAKYQVQP